MKTLNNSLHQLKKRKQTDSIKWDLHYKMGFDNDVIPMWVADMDFISEPHASEALANYAKHGLFGYTLEPEDYRFAIDQWCMTRHQVDVSKAKLITSLGVVNAIAMIIQACTKQNDDILIMEPVYHPFRKMIEINKRNCVVSALKLNHNHYEMDFDDIRQKIREHHVKMIIFCSPHNPVGRVWTKTELIQLADLCKEYNVLLLSDDIHMDFIYPKHKHHMIISLNDEYKNFVITTISASKSFNLADTHVAQILVFNDNIASKIQHHFDKLGLNRSSKMVQEMQKEAYLHGSQYMDEVMSIVVNNAQIVKEILKDTKIKIIEPEGTYLLWLDFRAYHKKASQLMDMLINDAKVWLINGATFGDSGEGFFRMNIATSSELVTKASKQIKETFIALV